MEEIELKITKLVSRAMDDTRTVCEYKNRCADDLNAILEHTTKEILKTINDANTRKFGRSLN